MDDEIVIGMQVVGVETTFYHVKPGNRITVNNYPTVTGGLGIMWEMPREATLRERALVASALENHQEAISKGQIIQRHAIIT